jgi:hypothetical protein
MPRTYIIFGDIEGNLDVLRVECTKCSRKGRYHVAKLIEEYGRKANMMKWREMLNSDCPRRDALGLSDRCDLICPDLPRCSDKLLARGAPLWRQSGPPLICALGNAGMVVSGASAPIVNSSSLGALNAGNCNRSASDMVFASGSPAEGARRRGSDAPFGGSPPG